MKFVKVSIFIVVFVVSLELLLRLSGMAYKGLQHLYGFFQNSSGVPIVLCIGESTTAYGLGESYPAQLQQRLEQKFGKGKVFVVNEGFPGTDTEKIKKALDENIERYNPSVVITMIGINDTWQLRGVKEGWFTEFKIYKLWKLAETNFIAYQEARKRRRIAALAFPKNLPKEVDEGDYHMVRSDYASAAEFYKKSLKDDTPSWLHFKVGIALLRSGNRADAVPYFEKYLQTDYQLQYMIDVIILYYYEFGQFVRENHLIARQLAEKILERYPDNPKALRIAGLTYKEEDAKKAIYFLEKAVAAGDTLDGSYSALAISYKAIKEYKKAEAILRKGMFSESDMGYFMTRDLIDLFIEQKKFAEAKVELEKAIERFPDNQNFLDYRLQIAVLAGEKVDMSQVKDVKYWVQNFLKFPPTRRNYADIAMKLKEKNIKHIAMQYPVRKIDEIKEILKDFPDVAFVENRENFEKALKTKKYDELFSDRFANDFGHFTPLGAAMIVDNLAPVVESALISIQ